MFKKLLHFILPVCFLSFGLPVKSTVGIDHETMPKYGSRTMNDNDEATENYTPVFTPDENGNVTLTYDGEKQTINVYDELDKQKEYYEDLKFTNSERTSDIQVLIDKTVSLKKEYQEYITVYKPFNPNKPSTQVVTAPSSLLIMSDIGVILALYIKKNYPLSCELLTKSLVISDEDAANENYVYHPLHTDPFYSSSAIWNELKENASFTEEGMNIAYCKNNKNASMNSDEKDLELSIRSAVVKSDNYNVTITDKYDFAEDDSNAGDVKNELIKIVNNLAYSAQKRHIIKPYNIEVDLDFSKALMTSVERQNDSYYVNVKNIASSPVIMSYNSKLCFNDDGYNWKNLANVQASRLASGQETKIKIDDNGWADSIALSYVLDNIKYVTVLDELELAEKPIIRIHEMKSVRSTIGNFRFTLLGMNSASYVVSVENLSQSSYKMKYGYKSMSLSDAKNMMNADSIENTIYPNSMEIMHVNKSINGIYTPVNIYDLDEEKHICLSLIKATEGGKLTAELLGTTPVFTFLGIWNWGKSNGQWNIEIQNPKAYDIVVYYNAKMCFADDAKNWKNLNDVKSVKVPKGDVRHVLISTNYFATTVVFSYISNSKRLVTYADSLTSGGDMDIKNNIL